MQVVSVIEFRSSLEKYLDAVSKSGDTIIVSEENEDEAVIISIKEYNPLIETGHLLSTTANRKSLLESINQIQSDVTRKCNS